MSECLGRLLQPYSDRLHQIALLSPDANDIIEFKGGQWTARSPGEYWADLLADPTVQAYAYTGLPFTITNDKRLLGRDSALPPFTASEISIGTGLTLSSSTLSLDATAAVTSITGTANQVIASASVGSVTLSLPQNIATSSNVAFNQLTLSEALISVADGSVFSRNAASINAQYMYLGNTGGNCYWAIEDSTGSTFGGTAYGSLIYSMGPLEVFIGGTRRSQTSATGILISGSLTTSSPSGGTAQPWKWGNYTAGAATQAGTVRVEINGTPYDLLTA
jgi:hypothetical protein